MLQLLQIHGSQSVHQLPGLSLVWVEEAETEEEEQEEVSGYWDEYWNTNKPTTRYYYEGQMGIEEDYTREIEESMETDVTRYGLGARGIDFLEVDAYDSSPLAKSPLYDEHGNMIATLTKGSGGTYQVSARRYTDPWGVTRVGASTGSPDQRYFANLATLHFSVPPLALPPTHGETPRLAMPPIGRQCRTCPKNPPDGDQTVHRPPQQQIPHVLCRFLVRNLVGRVGLEPTTR
ncbi:MAG: hypothetical protein AMXMBFR81_19160 [Chthonomonas sp.]